MSKPDVIVDKAGVAHFQDTPNGKYLADLIGEPSMWRSGFSVNRIADIDRIYINGQQVYCCVSLVIVEDPDELERAERRQQEAQAYLEALRKTRARSEKPAPNTTWRHRETGQIYLMLGVTNRSK